MLRHIIFFTLLLGVASAIVHKFLARPHRLHGEAARIRQNALEKMRLEEIRETWPELYQQNELPSSIALNRSEDTYYTYLTNITIGTPAKIFVAEVDLFYSSDLCVISSSADLSEVLDNLPEKHTYDASKSSSFVDLNKNFTDWRCGKGKNGSDQVTIDTISANVAMGIVDAISYDFLYDPVDAVLGLNPNVPQSNKDNFASQLVAGLDKPIMSWSQNVFVGYEETAQLTLGGEDTDNCQSKYTYVPQIRSRYGLSGFRVHLASGSIDGMPDFVKGLNTTLKVSPNLSRMYLNDDFFYLLTNASNASWNETINEWEVDCNVTKAKNITLNIGSDGNTADANTKQLVLTGADYIQYDSRKNTCIVYANRYKYVASVTMINRFLNKHCIAYNAKEKTIGFADANR